MSAIMPLFPLQLVVYPGEPLNLHIFEERYKQLIGECEREGTTFGIPAYFNRAVQDTGTEVELVEVVKRYPNGEIDIKTRGLSIFRVDRFYKQAPGKLYAGGEVAPIPFSTEGDFLKSKKILELTQELFRLLKVGKEPPAGPETFVTYDIGHEVGFSLPQEYELLCMPEERARQDFMLQHLEQFLPRVREMERIREKIKMNGHFRNLKPPKF